jgi:hypothetical protein
VRVSNKVRCCLLSCYKANKKNCSVCSRTAGVSEVSKFLLEHTVVSENVDKSYSTDFEVGTNFFKLELHC